MTITLQLKRTPLPATKIIKAITRALRSVGVEVIGLNVALGDTTK